MYPLAQGVPFLFALCTLSVRSEEGQGPSWTLVGGYAKQISAKGDHVWAANELHQMFHLVNNAWSEPNGFVSQVGAGNDGFVWITQRENNSIWRYDGSKKGNLGGWQYIPGGLQKVAGYNKTSAVGVNSYGNMFRYAGGQWRILPGLGYDISIGDGDEIWMIDHNSELYRLNNNQWKKVGRKAKFIDVQSPQRIVMTDSNDSAFKWTGSDWQQLGGQQCVSASINYKSVYCVTPGGAIYKMDV